MPPNPDSEVARLLRRSTELLTVVAKAALAPILERELADPKLCKLYQLTGGEHAREAIQKKLGMGASRISRLWQRWEELGLLIKEGKRYRKTL